MTTGELQNLPQNRERREARSRHDPAAFSVFIHDVNPWGGQDKVTLEIIKRLRFDGLVNVYAYSFEDDVSAASSPVEGMAFHRVIPSIQRPVLLKSIVFHLFSSWIAVRNRFRGRRVPSQSAGACALFSDFVQVHFVHRAWRARQAQLAHSDRFGRNGLCAGVYHALLAWYDLWTERLVFREGRSFIAVSNRVAEEIRRFYPRITDISVVHPGVDTERFRPSESTDARLEYRRRIGIADDVVLLLFIGAFARKGLRAAIEALAKAKAGCSRKLALLAIGQGDVAGYREQAERCGVGRQVHFLAPVKDVAPYFRAADLFLLPTVYEPFGLVILEAMASGLPVIVPKNAGAGELIRDFENGVTITDASDSDEIARKIRSVLVNPHLLPKMASAARATAVSQSWDVVASRYQEVLAARAQS